MILITLIAEKRKKNMLRRERGLMVEHLLKHIC